MQPSDNNIAIKLYADGKKVEIPYITKHYNLKVNFDTLTTRLNKVEHSSGETPHLWILGRSQPGDQPAAVIFC